MKKVRGEKPFALGGKPEQLSKRKWGGTEEFAEVASGSTHTHDMNDQTIGHRLQHLEQRLIKMEALQQNDCSQPHQKMAWGLRDTAKLLALRSLVQELAVSAGVSPEHADTTFQSRVHYYLDCLHQMAERRDVGLAAKSDDRSLDEIPTDSAFPSLFEDAED